MPVKFIYATRSKLPAKKANAVQSIHMASVFDKRFRDCESIFQSHQKQPAVDSFFEPFDLSAPRNLKLIRVRPSTEWSHGYVMRYAAHFKKCASSAIVYTRSTRIAWAAVKAKRPCILELHDPLIPIRIRSLKTMLQKGWLRGIVATTARLKDEILRAVPIDEQSITVFGGAACADYARCEPRAYGDSSTFKVAYSGSALRGKGLEIILSCAQILPAVQFHIVGPSQKESKKLGQLSENLVFHGFHQGVEIIRILKSMDALLLPNQKSVIIQSGADIGGHTSPLKLFEYMSAGKPIIASDLPVFEGILRHGENALLAQHNSPETFCKHIETLQSNSSQAIRIGSTAQKDFSTNFTWEHRANHIIRFMEKLDLIDADADTR